MNKQNYIEKNEEEFERRRRLILDVMGEKTYIPMKEKELAILLDIPREKRRELREVLESLLADGLISASKKGKLGRPEVFSETGIFTGHPKGFGFVKVEGRSMMYLFPERT